MDPQEPIPVTRPDIPERPPPDASGRRPARDASTEDSQGSPVARPRPLRRVAPALGLVLLAPLVGEYLLGSVPFSGILAVPFLMPMYGGGALLVRETARRAGRGWPTILLLAAAYGLLQAGMLDQSLFNPTYGGTPGFQRAAYVPLLGISAANALAFVGGHVIWSIGIPIALIETLVPDRRTTPWLGGVGLAVTGVVFLLGSFLIFDDHRRTEQFLATPGQLLGTTVVVVALVGAAFAVGRRPRPRLQASAPRPWLVGVVAFVTASIFFGRPQNWPGVVVGLVVLAAMAVVVTRWSRRDGWGAAHRLALAGGALLTYAWGAFAVLDLQGTATPLNLVGQGVLILGAVALLLAAGRAVRRTSGAR